MRCLYCKIETVNPKFCSRSCAAKFNNSKYPKRSGKGFCKSCNIKISISRTYCSNCWSGNKTIALNRLNKWINGEWSGGTNKGLSNTVRNYLLKEANYSCSSCGFNKNHPDDNKTILEINHINGDGTDHKRENLEVLCPNCHALTSTYRGRNYGKGRPVYYSRIHK